MDRTGTHKSYKTLVRDTIENVTNTNRRNEHLYLIWKSVSKQSRQQHIAKSRQHIAAKWFPEFIECMSFVFYSPNNPKPKRLSSLNPVVARVARRFWRKRHNYQSFGFRFYRQQGMPMTRKNVWAPGAGGKHIEHIASAPHPTPTWSKLYIMASDNIRELVHPFWHQAAILGDTCQCASIHGTKVRLCKLKLPKRTNLHP